MQLATPSISQTLARYPERKQHIIEEMCQVMYHSSHLLILYHETGENLILQLVLKLISIHIFCKLTG